MRDVSNFRFAVNISRKRSTEDTLFPDRSGWDHFSCRPKGSVAGPLLPLQPSKTSIQTQNTKNTRTLYTRDRKAHCLTTTGRLTYASLQPTTHSFAILKSTISDGFETEKWRDNRRRHWRSRRKEKKNSISKLSLLCSNRRCKCDRRVVMGLDLFWSCSMGIGHRAATRL